MSATLYAASTVEEVASFHEDTRGLWFGRFRDVFGARALVKIVISY